MRSIKKIDIIAVMATLALILAIANMYTSYNIMNEINSMYSNILTIEQSIEHFRYEVKGTKELWNLTRYNFILILTSEMEIRSEEARVVDGVALFRWEGDTAVFNVVLPLNTTYRIDIFANSGPQTEITRGSALEIVCDGITWGIVTFTAEEWNWEYLCSGQMYAGLHEIQIINREGGQLGDTNIDFTQIRILWLKE